jgi:hypothetical protein
MLDRYFRRFFAAEDTIYITSERLQDSASFGRFVPQQQTFSGRRRVCLSGTDIQVRFEVSNAHSGRF